ncbi:MAG: hypothetical protein ABR518_08050 [Actinomycetota bacterium]
MPRPDPQTTGESPLLSFLAMFVSVEATGAATWLLLADQRLLAGFAALVAFAVMVGIIPVVPGARRRFAERTVDRLFDACLLAAVAWVWRGEAPLVSILALVGLAASYLAAYERARGEALGYRGREAVPYRAVRQGLLVLALLTGWVQWTLAAFGVVTILAAGVRASNVVAQERRRQLMTWGVG